MTFDKTSTWRYDQKKIRRQYMLTDDSAAIIQQLANELSISLSEVLERTIRSGGLEAARNYGVDRSVAPLDNPVAISQEDADWLDSLPGGDRSHHLELALKHYRGWWKTFGEPL